MKRSKARNRLNTIDEHIKLYVYQGDNQGLKDTEGAEKFLTIWLRPIFEVVLSRILES
jgi:hypothetical protein